ncbi:forkhead box protein J1 [Harpia harpyja]|uniref:forkhead box protein J1 n=1 Tax=Harpia harpyja TaxID=202280 RepID=UPI0022B0B653|nr:forkhead box protein J1 [Harpia harpyja]XP_052664955.1 forkhead box protein J1 [Harpia harpyja]
MQELPTDQGMAEGWLNRPRAGLNRGQKASMGDSDDLDDSLTSLMWLQDFSIMNTSMGKSSCCPSGPDPHDCHRIPSFAAPCSPLAADPACMGMPHTPCKPISSSTSRTAHHAMAMHPQLAEDIDYKTNPYVKPPYSYATLICMAMEASKKPKITLSAIYKWITDNFCYFRHADPTWQNSIRHNLSLNKCFIKVPREKGEPGKGGFWKLDPQYADRLKNGAFKKRRMPPVQIHPAFTKTVQEEAQCVASPAASACTSSNVLNVNMESQQLLKEFEEVTGGQNWNPVNGKAGQKRKQPLPKRTTKASRLSNSALLTQEEQTELGSLKGDFDWEAIFDTNLNGDFPTFGDLDLTPPISPVTHDLDLTVHGHHINCPQGQEQVLTESDQNNLDFDETFMATSFLQHPWDEGTNDYLSNSVNMEQLFDLNDTSLPADVSDWSSLASLL